MSEINSVSKFESSSNKAKPVALKIVEFIEAIYPQGIYQIVCIPSARKLAVKSFERNHQNLV